MSSAKKLLEAAAGTAAAGGATSVSDVFSTYVYDGKGSTGQQIENGLNLGDSLAGPYTEFSAESNVGGYLYRSGDFTNNSDSKTFTFSFWINSRAGDNFRVYYSQGTQTSNFRFYVMTSNNYFKVAGFSSDGTTLLDTGWITIANFYGSWFNFLISVDMASTSNRYLYVNDAQVLGPSSSWDTYNNGTIDFTNSHHYVKSNGGNVQADGGLAQVYLDYTYRDLSSVSNRRTFIKADLTPAGDLSSLNPILYLPLDYTNSTVTNSGTGGNFVAYNTGQIEAKEKGGPGIDSGGGKGGLVWAKSRSSTTDGHRLYDTARGVGYRITSADTDAQSNNGSTATVSSFNSNGFSIPPNAYAADSGKTYVAWSFRKAEKFFDIVTYTGTGVAGRTLSHNLGSVPGMVLIKPLTTGGWSVYHRSMDSSSPEDYYLILNTAAARANDATRWNDTAPTSTQITLGNNNQVNENGEPFVAYLFAHETDDDSMIQCGSFTSSSGEASVTLGWEPQFLMYKEQGGAGGWIVEDTMRGFSAGTTASKTLLWESDAVEATEQKFHINATGFATDGDGPLSSGTFIYMAIRAPMMKEPEAATDVFAIDTVNAAAPFFTSGFPVDMGFYKSTGGSAGYISSRLMGQFELETNTTAGQGGASAIGYDDMTGFVGSNPGSGYYSWMWKRAKGYMDAVAYTGTGSNTTQAHSLGVAPEMMWVKRRSATEDWTVWTSSLGGNDKYLNLNDTAAVGSAATIWNNTAPTSTVFSIGTQSRTNASSSTYVAYLFATLAGISKVGSYTGSGSTNQTIDCGFTNGARFVLIKRTSGEGAWYLFDSLRGIVAGSDPSLRLDNTGAQSSGDGDIIDPASTGFTLITSSGDYNGSGQSYIFYAIA